MHSTTSVELRYAGTREQNPNMYFETRERDENDEKIYTPYDFGNDMKVCNSYVALNSKWFCVGLVGEFDIN